MPIPPIKSDPAALCTGPFYVIGDVHGCADELSALLDQLDITPDTSVALVGDYIDRGPDSRQVMEVVLELSQRCALVPLLGNHEAMFLSFLSTPESPQSVMFIYNGGGATLASYADDLGRYVIPHEHVALLHDLKLWYETPDYFVVHAGVPELPLESLDPASSWEDLLWTRGMKDTSYAWSKVVVHGHTCTREVQVHDNRINVDTACVFDNMLSAIELRTRRVFSVRRGAGRAPQLLRDATSRRAAVRFRGAARVRLFHLGHAHDFETVNYSQTGMLLRWLGEKPEPHLPADQMVGGIVGVGSASALAFTAVMVRRESKPEGLFYGLRILPPQGSAEVSQLARGLVEADAAAEAEQWAKLIGVIPPKGRR